MKPPRDITQQHMDDVAKQFAEDVEHHQLIIVRNDGLYRHLRAQQPKVVEMPDGTKKPGCSFFWFDIVTWPNHLTITGDFGEAYTFTREPDMLGFFRIGSRGREHYINPTYWDQKLVGPRRSASAYSPALLRRLIQETVDDAIQHGDWPRELRPAVADELLSDEGLLEDQGAGMQAVMDFSFVYTLPGQEHLPQRDRRTQTFRFDDAWEWGDAIVQHTRTFLWACHAISWAVTRYWAQVVQDAPVDKALV